MLIQSDHYWLRNAHIPESLILRSKRGRSQDWSVSVQEVGQDGLLAVDIEVAVGAIASIARAGTLSSYPCPSVDLQGGMVFPCFVDIHTHLDKGHVWERTPNPDGTFASALEYVAQDAKTWNQEDIYRRMEFGLKCSYVHGTKAIRTHLDLGGKLTDISLEVFKALRDQWRDRLILQAVSMISLDQFLTPEGEKIADRMAEIGGILGGFAVMNPDIEIQMERLFALAKDRRLDLDIHTDETNDPESMTLRYVAQAAIRSRFPGQVVCGHCCSLAVQPPEVAAKTMALVKQAKIGIVSLPLCNLYLQDRQPRRTPRWRGVTLLHELKQAKIHVAIASDNCRDPFYGFGDHDGLEVFTLSAKIAHLDRPYGNWINTITQTPADLMGLPTVGRIGVGLPADLVICKARRYSELLSRSQRDRLVLRNGVAIDTTLPDYAELDDLLTTPNP
jgi:cytosine deaminase